MTNSLLTCNLVRKSKRAILSAQLAVQHGDFDNAANRAYYAMFDMAKVALLNSGSSESDLPRTHRGLISVFGQKIVASGKMDAEAGRSLNWVEGLRLRADYSDVEIDAKTAIQAVGRAEAFLSAVERAFSMEAASIPHLSETDKRKGDEEKVSDLEVTTGYPQNVAASRPYSIEDEQRQARENWLRYRKQHTVEANLESKDVGHGASNHERSLDDSDG